MPSLAQAFGSARMAVGAVSWLTPSLSAKIFGIDPARADPLVTQLFGVRDFALGYLTATASGPTRGQVLRVGVAIDTADTLASIRQMRRGNLSPRAIVLVAGGAALFAATGVALASESSA
jgi:hypothetical protein